MRAPYEFADPSETPLRERFATSSVITLVGIGTSHAYRKLVVMRVTINYLIDVRYLLELYLRTGADW